MESCLHGLFYEYDWAVNRGFDLSRQGRWCGVYFITDLNSFPQIIYPAVCMTTARWHLISLCVCVCLCVCLCVYVSSTSGVASPGVPEPCRGLGLVGVCLELCCWRLDAHCCALIAHSASDVFWLPPRPPAAAAADDEGSGLGEFITPTAAGLAAGTAVHGWRGVDGNCASGVRWGGSMADVPGGPCIGVWWRIAGVDGGRCSADEGVIINGVWHTHTHTLSK